MEGKDELDHRAIAADISEDEHILQVSEENEVSERISVPRVLWCYSLF